MIKNITQQRLEKSINLQGRVDIRDVADFVRALKERGENIKLLSEVVKTSLSLASRVAKANGYTPIFTTVEEAYQYLAEVGLIKEDVTGKRQLETIGRSMAVEQQLIGTREWQKVVDMWETKKVVHVSPETETEVEELIKQQAQKDREQIDLFKTTIPKTVE